MTSVSLYGLDGREIIASGKSVYHTNFLGISEFRGVEFLLPTDDPVQTAKTEWTELSEVAGVVGRSDYLEVRLKQERNRD